MRSVVAKKLPPLTDEEVETWVSRITANPRLLYSNEYIRWANQNYDGILAWANRQEDAKINATLRKAGIYGETK